VNGNGKGGTSFLAQMALLVGILVGLFGVILPLYSDSGGPVPSQVASNTADIDAIQTAITDEKICTESNQMACIDLFRRLQGNITRRQRQTLACSVARYLDEVQTTIECPPRRT
jgi:hypothetical protein